MNGSVDLRSLLDAWPHDPDENVRIIRGHDGREIMQVRLPLGMEQYELDGRPDGRRPHGMVSALDYQLRRLALAQAKGREDRMSPTAAISSTSARIHMKAMTSIYHLLKG